MTYDERHFLLSFKEKNPKWDLLGLPNIEEVTQLPSVQWKLLNLSRRDKSKHQKAAKKLKVVLFP